MTDFFVVVDKIVWNCNIDICLANNNHINQNLNIKCRQKETIAHGK